MSRHMEQKRFDELGIQGLKTQCPQCGEDFNITISDTIGGGWGVIGVRCPHCGRQFGIDGGG